MSQQVTYTNPTHSLICGRPEPVKTEELIRSYAIALYIFLPSAYCFYNSLQNREWRNAINEGTIALSSFTVITVLFFNTVQV